MPNRGHGFRKGKKVFVALTTLQLKKAGKISGSQGGCTEEGGEMWQLLATSLISKKGRRYVSHTTEKGKHKEVQKFTN